MGEIMNDITRLSKVSSFLKKCFSFPKLALRTRWWCFRFISYVLLLCSLILVAITCPVVTLLSSPLAAQVDVTPSLKNLLNSVVAGGVVVASVGAAVAAVANFDPVDRA